MGFDFDINWQSAGIGYGAGLLTGYAIYQSRHALGTVRRAFSDGGSTQSLGIADNDRRYINELTKYAQKQHLFSDNVPLSDILVEPRFISDRELKVAVDEDDELRKPFNVVPIVADYPHLHQPYNIPTVSVEELGYGDRALALLGESGSGRTTALLAIALWSMRKIEFHKPHDPVAEHLKESSQNLTREERDERKKIQVAIEQRAKEQLREELGVDISEIDRAVFVPPFRKMAPIYIHLANVYLDNRSWRGNVDPAEPLIRALQFQTGNITSKTAPRKIYRLLNDGDCLLLLDGLDELSVQEQSQKIAWLNALLSEYNENFIIVAGPTSGYGKLQNIGFTPIHLRPWSRQDVSMYTRLLSDNWGDIVKQRGATIDEDTQLELIDQLWGLHPVEATIKIQSYVTGDKHDEYDKEFAYWTHNYITSRFEDAEDAMPMMATAARLQLDNYFFNLNDWIEIEIATALNTPLPTNTDLLEEDATDADDEFQMSDSTFADEFEQEVDMFGTDDTDNDFSMFEEADIADTSDDLSFNPSTTEDNTDEDKKRDETKEAGEVRRTVRKLLTTLIKTGLVQRYQGNRYRFSQSHIASYLASRTLFNIDEPTLIEKATDPNWSTAIAYASSGMDITRAVETKMGKQTDILLSNILDVVHWLRYSDEFVEWRNKYFNYLGQMFISPSQYVSGRERIAAALMTTRDPVVTKIFKRGTENNNVDVRRLSILALGAFQQPDMMDNLSAFFTDADDNVRVASVLAVGNLHTEEADTLISSELFDTRSERVQQAIAETLADKPDVGYQVLWELLNDENYTDQIRVRRAAVYGLQRLRTEWSLEEIYNTYLNEQQWMVKSTAQTAFTNRQSQRSKGIQPYPQIITLPWLREWSMELDEESLAEASGVELLNMALREPTVLIRYLATTTSGQLGVYENIPDLYQLLNDQEDVIRDTAYRALTDLQMRMGQSLPLAN